MNKIGEVKAPCLTPQELCNIIGKNCLNLHTIYVASIPIYRVILLSKIVLNMCEELSFIMLIRKSIV